MNEVALRRRLAELLGSAFLTAVVIGSGIAAQHLSPGATGPEPLENAAATAAGLAAIVLTFGPLSGALFNPSGSLSVISTGIHRPASVRSASAAARTLEQPAHATGSAFAQHHQRLRPTSISTSVDATRQGCAMQVIDNCRYLLEVPASRVHLVLQLSGQDEATLTRPTDRRMPCP